MVESVANGVELNPGQARLVRELATSGGRLQLALAPAGTGKTTAMRVLARAWTADGGHVVGLAPSAAAAAALRAEIGVHTDTLSKLLHCLGTGDRPPSQVAEILASRDRTLGGITAPPQGLELVEVRYDGVPRRPPSAATV